MSGPKCLRCGAGSEWIKGRVPDEPNDEVEAKPSAPVAGSAVGGKFYKGMEWFGAWLVDHAEGEIISEELVHRWAVEAWHDHLKKQTTPTLSHEERTI
jgi:hypothetical protein